ncbi:hypothetical protein DASC09_056270 [Saccharomycopsis crataegensis]|uniref:ATPase inhibitor, mitochondrial n=1 Tax=Saccharomycopsis crataegensis TaxID=43959 RepID=A0AAV5QTX2_9ASCO|nr:hypothetical protein DASC09_056270 [Saccharomycopsis crataegensis]
MVFALTRRLAVSGAAKRVVAAPSFAVRSYSEGHVAPGSKAFSEKEKAQEDMYIKEHEREQLKKLKDSLAKIKEQTATLESEISKIEKN